VAKYLTLGSYTAEGLKGLLKEGGSARRKVVEDGVKALGGRLESFYFAFGEHDIVAISEAPDNITVAAFAMVVGASGAARVRTVVLMTPEEVDRAIKQTQSLSYRAPGQ
jgi:uncharacterized protein with GYD domain